MKCRKGQAAPGGYVRGRRRGQRTVRQTAPDGGARRRTAAPDGAGRRRAGAGRHPGRRRTAEDVPDGGRRTPGGGDEDAGHGARADESVFGPSCFLAISGGPLRSPPRRARDGT